MPPGQLPKSLASSSLFDAFPRHIYKIAAPAARRIYHQQCKMTFSTASVKVGSVLACTALPLHPQERTSPDPGRSSFYRSCLKPSLSRYKNALASSRACSRVRMSRPQPPARKIIPIEISGWPVARESHLEDPAHGRARKAATRADAGGDSSNGYWYIRIDGKGYLGHRLAWLYMHGHFPDGMLDHKNHNRSSCRIADLRKATQSQNAANTNLRATSTSGFKVSAGIRSTTNIAPKSGSEEKSWSWVSTIRQEKPRGHTTTWRLGYSGNLR